MLEVCVDTVQAAVAACEAGAERIELCSALDVGGVTPCQSLIRAVRRRVDCPLVVLIRPRTGDFVYDQCERDQSLESIHIALGCGADGVVVGALQADSKLDLLSLSAMRIAAAGFQLVMHRAFDFVDEPRLAIDQLIEIGFERILTSGGRSGHVMNHLETLKHCIDYASDRIVIMPGGGVTAANAATVLSATGCRQLHGSFRLPPVQLGNEGLGTNRAVDDAAVKLVSGLWLRSDMKID